MLKGYFSARGLVVGGLNVRGLSVLVSSTIEGFKRYELPTLVAEEVTNISLGVNYLAVSSRHSPKVWLHPLNSAVVTPPARWQVLSLPSEDLSGSGRGWRREEGRDVHGEVGGVAMVAIGLAHSVFLANSGKVYSLGLNYFGQCGAEPSLMQTKEGAGLGGQLKLRDMLAETGVDKVKQVVCGLDHTLLLLEDGSVWACGWAADGQTGVGSQDHSRLMQVELGGRKARFLSSCADSSFAITECDHVLAWGNNEYRQLGVASTEPQVTVPHNVDVSCMDGVVTAIAAGGAFSAFLTAQGSVYVCGYNVEGQSDGHPSSADWRQMRQLHNGLVEGRVLMLTAGLNYLFALNALSDRTGRVWGKLELPHCTRHWHCPNNFELDSKVLDVACGPLGLAILTTTDSSQHELISLLSTHR